jgi:acylglycerol lipase
MAEYFARNKFVVNMIDLRSFGYSGGLRVNEPIRGLLSDIENLLRRCCEIGLPTYVVSHGFGCLLALALLEENPRLPLAGVIAMSPLFTFPFFTNTSWVGKGVLWLLSFVFEDMIINNMINPTSLTNNHRRVKGCIDGVFSYQFISINMVQEYAELSEKVLLDAHKFEYPLLMLYGARNEIQPKEQVKRFYQLARSREKNSFIFKNGYHQIFKDEGAEDELFPKILEWITDDTSNKNQTKWTNTPPLNLRVLTRTPRWIKLLAFALVPLLVLLFLRLRKRRP